MIGRLFLTLLASLAVGLPHARAQRAYVCNQDDATVSIIDVTTNHLIETLDLQKLGFGPNAKPHHAQVEPDGSFWYLTLIGAGKVLKLDWMNRIVGSVDLEVPGLLAIHPSRDLLVVGRSMSAVNPPKRIALIRRSDLKLLDEVEVFFPRPHALVVDPRGDYVYVASLGVNQFASVRLEDGHSELVDFDGPPQSFTQFAVSPDAKWLVLTAQLGNQLLVYDINDPAKPVLAKTVPVEKGPFESVFTADGRTLFVTNLDANRVSQVDVPSWTVRSVLASEGFGQPHGVALSPDNRFLYVSNRHQAGGAHDHEGHKALATGTVVVVCVPTAAVDTVLQVGNYAAGVGISAPRPGASPPRSCR